MAHFELNFSMQLPSHSTYRPMVPLLIWDGQCGFCKYWVTKWHRLTGDAVRYLPYQQVYYDIEEIPKTEFARAVRLIGTDGKIYTGAHAAYKALQFAPKWAFLCNWYGKSAWFKNISDFGYRVISNHRPLLYRLTTHLFGKDPQRPVHLWVLYLVVLLVAVVWVLKVT